MNPDHFSGDKEAIKGDASDNSETVRTGADDGGQLFHERQTSVNGQVEGGDGRKWWIPAQRKHRWKLQLKRCLQLSIIDAVRPVRSPNTGRHSSSHTEHRAPQCKHKSRQPRRKLVTPFPSNCAHPNPALSHIVSINKTKIKATKYTFFVLHQPWKTTSRKNISDCAFCVLQLMFFGFNLFVFGAPKLTISSCDQNSYYPRQNI